MNIRSPTSNPVLQTIELSMNSRTWPLVQWVLLAWNRSWSEDPYLPYDPNALGQQICRLCWCLGGCPLSQLRRRTLKYPVPTKLADTECTSPNGMASGVTYCCHWIAAVHDYTILFFRLCQFFSWINLFQQLLKVYLVFFFTSIFWSSLVSQPNTMAPPLAPEDLPLVSLQHSMNTRPRAEGNSRVKNGPVKGSDFFRNPAIGFQGV